MAGEGMRGPVAAGAAGPALVSVAAAAPFCILALAPKPCKTLTESKLHLESEIQ